MQDQLVSDSHEPLKQQCMELQSALKHQSGTTVTQPVLSSQYPETFNLTKYYLW